MKNQDLISIFEAYDLLEGRNSMTNRQDPATICSRIWKIRNSYLPTNMIFRKPTVETDQLLRGLDSLYSRIYDKIGLKYHLEEDLTEALKNEMQTCKDRNQN